MKLRILGLLAVYLLIGNFSSIFAAERSGLVNLDKVPGYGGLALGEAFPKTGFTLEQNRGALKIYRKNGEKLLLGPASLEAILYYVFEGKFYGVAFHTKDGEDSVELQHVFTTAFGEGKNEKGGGPSTLWLGHKNALLFEINTSTGDGNAFLFNVKLHDALLNEQDASAQTAAQKLIQGN